MIKCEFTDCLLTVYLFVFAPEEGRCFNSGTTTTTAFQFTNCRNSIFCKSVISSLMGECWIQSLIVKINWTTPGICQCGLFIGNLKKKHMIYILYSLRWQYTDLVCSILLDCNKQREELILCSTNNADCTCLYYYVLSHARFASHVFWFL